jgi:hypothetical protein
LSYKETSASSGPDPHESVPSSSRDRSAANAEVNGTTLLHYDRHFDAIGRVTGQPMEWLARRGSLDQP